MCGILYFSRRSWSEEKRKEKTQVGQNIDPQDLVYVKGPEDVLQNWHRWIEYRQPIDLLDQPSNMELGLFKYGNKNGSMWTYDLTHHLMVKLEIIIAFASMTYIVELFCLGYIEWMNECSIISSVISKYVLLRVI